MHTRHYYADNTNTLHTSSSITSRRICHEAHTNNADAITADIGQLVVNSQTTQYQPATDFSFKPSTQSLYRSALR